MSFCSWFSFSVVIESGKSRIRGYFFYYIGTVFPAIISEVIGDWEVQAVNSKDLHEFLWLEKNHYSRWIEKTIIWNEYSIEWEDYILEHWPKCESNICVLTLDFAKRLSMRSNSEKGEEVRKYFIECEKRVQKSITKPRTYEVVMQEALLLADHNKKPSKEGIIWKLRKLYLEQNNIRSSTIAIYH